MEQEAAVVLKQIVTARNSNAFCHPNKRKLENTRFWNSFSQKQWKALCFPAFPTLARTTHCYFQLFQLFQLLSNYGARCRHSLKKTGKAGKAGNSSVFCHPDQKKLDSTMVFSILFSKIMKSIVFSSFPNPRAHKTLLFQAFPAFPAFFFSNYGARCRHSSKKTGIAWKAGNSNVFCHPDQKKLENTMFFNSLWQNKRQHIEFASL